MKVCKKCGENHCPGTIISIGNNTYEWEPPILCQCERQELEDSIKEMEEKFYQAHNKNVSS